jgi:hypothetical protein
MWMDELKKALAQESIGFASVDEPTGAISLNLKDEDCLVEVHSDRSLVCLFGMDMEELKGMIAGDSTEDLSGDELQRAAKESLRQTVGTRGITLRRFGFQEETQITDEYYVLAYRKSLDQESMTTTLSTVRDCLKILSGRT